MRADFGHHKLSNLASNGLSEGAPLGVVHRRSRVEDLFGE